MAKQSSPNETKMSRAKKKIENRNYTERNVVWSVKQRISKVVARISELKEAMLSKE